MRLKYLNLVLIVIVFLCSGACKKKEQQPEAPKPGSDPHFSATWVTNVASNAMDSRENIRQTVATCKKSGIQNIFIVVWNQGLTLYPSTLMESTFGIKIASKFQGRDPLQEMIEEAHKENIKVHAWFEYGFASSYNQNGGLILQTKPEWAAKDVQGKLLSKNGFEWMNAFLPEVQDFMTSLVLEVVKNYAIDGVQGDDRLPALPSTGGYDTYTVNLYKAQHNGAAPPANYNDADWLNWRTDLLTTFLGKLYQKVKAEKPGVLFSTAPSVHPFAKTEYLQDWPTWLDKGYTDLVIPQVYRYDIAAYQATLKQQLGYLKPQHRKKFYPGILIQNGNYNPGPEFMQQMIEENRRQGISGESFWFFEGIKQFPAYFETYNR